MDNYQKVEQLVNKAGCSYEDAKAALEACGWDMLDAVISLEREGKVNKNIYGGGYAGEVGQTLVYIKETEGQKGTIKIEGNVFGGGEGITATVHERTKVEISLNINQTVEETLVDTESITEVSSGESACRVEKEEGYSYINGSVYGGGDLGQIGKGIIDTSNNTATISEEGRTEVKVENGYIGGSVFGGGNAAATGAAGVNDSVATVNIVGGTIYGNVYGGANTSIVYGRTQCKI